MKHNTINYDSIIQKLEDTKDDIKWVLNDDRDAFLSINTDRALIEKYQLMLKLIKNNGVLNSAGIETFFRDKNENIIRGLSIDKPWAKYLAILPSGKRVWLKYEETDEGYRLNQNQLNKFGLTEITLDIPVFFKLKGTDLGNVFVSIYEAPFNHVTGEENPYWGKDNFVIEHN